jgi:hypothetical protein
LAVFTGNPPAVVLPPQTSAANNTDPPAGMLTVELDESNVVASLSTST